LFAGIYFNNHYTGVYDHPFKGLLLIVTILLLLFAVKLILKKISDSKFEKISSAGFIAFSDESLKDEIQKMLNNMRTPVEFNSPGSVSQVLGAAFGPSDLEFIFKANLLYASIYKLKKPWNDVDPGFTAKVIYTYYKDPMSKTFIRTNNLSKCTLLFFSKKQNKWFLENILPY
jgi:hypothetical protein